MRCSVLFASSLLLPATAVPAQDVPPAAVAVTGQRLASVLVDTTASGDILVLAPGYKARFAPDGVEYIPYYGPRAAGNHPITFRLRRVDRGGLLLVDGSAVAPRLDGLRVVYDRAGVREVWDLRAHEVEQTFAVEGSVGRGDLVFGIDVDANAPCVDVADGLRFDHEGLGAVHFGDVIAFDARGARCRESSRWTGDGIELRVPAAFADACRGELTVDPVVRTISIDAGVDDNIDPDVAYEANTDRWLVVYERVFSVRDSDIIARRYNGDGGLIEEVAVATGTRESHRPSVAANAGARQFLIAWDEDAGIADRVILGRFRTASNTTQGTTFTIRDQAGLGVQDRNPSVGGSIATDQDGDRYVVVSETYVNSVPAQMTVTRLRTDGTGFLLSFVGNANDQATDPAVTKARTNGGVWLCAYRSSGDVFAEGLPGANALGIGQIVDNSRIALGPPAVAGNGTDFGVIYSNRVNVGDNNLRLARLELRRGVLSLIDNDDVTVAEPGAVVRNDQKDPALAFDGCRFTYSYLESTGVAGNYDVYAAVVGYESGNTTPIFGDSHRLLHAQTPNDVEGEVAMASEAEMGGDAARSFIAWQQELSAANRDLVGCLFDGTAAAGGVSTVVTGCGGVFSPAVSAENAPAIGAIVRLRAARIAPAAQTWVIGFPSAPIPLCAQGCALGVFPILLTVPGSDLDLPIPCDFGAIGARVAAQTVFVGGPLGCPATTFGVQLNVSDTLVLQVQ
ncbi:MAG: hypothetical protein R3F56_09520 [Planctomycetota bacterium]